MENSAQQLTGGGFEGTIMAAACPCATPDVTSTLHTALEECHLSSLDEVALGDCSSGGSSMEPKSEYFSARVEEMMRSKSQFSSTVEHEIEHSRVHWTEVSDLSDFSEDKNDHEEVKRENFEVFAELLNDCQWKHREPGDFFMKWDPTYKLGQKIAEGGQGAIFEYLGSDGNAHPDLVYKVFKRGSRLSDLRRQWPHGILRREVRCIVCAGTMLDDGRFAFVLVRCWGDLRKLIDQAMQEKNNQGPPFPYEWNGFILLPSNIMRQIAFEMNELLKKGITHRDLKAANILLHTTSDKGILVFAADFESSIGVVGTRFWKAPEVLLALKNRTAIDFSEKMDVYSYDMTCFEIVIGRLPFEGELEPCRASYDLVIEGRRPILPSDLDVTLKDLIEKCWNPIPNERPSFSEIIEALLMYHHYKYHVK